MKIIIPLGTALLLSGCGNVCDGLNDEFKSFYAEQVKAFPPGDLEAAFDTEKLQESANRWSALQAEFVAADCPLPASIGGMPG